MMRANSGMLAVFLLAVLAALGGTALLQGGLYVGKHEGDTLHLLEIVFRMADGQWPHLDFMTPIGALAFAPIALFVDQGMGVGHAILWSQILVAAVLFPAVWWAAYSRFPGGWAYAFGFLVLMLALALVHGEAQRSVSISMHYNRWSWAVAYVVIALAMLPPLAGRGRPLPEGIIIGLGMAFLVLCKITYFVAFAIPVALALVLRRDWLALGAALVAGLAVAGAVSAVAGFDFWLAYLRDIATVAGSSVRAAPGEPFSAILGAPAYLGGSLAAILGVIFLRQTGTEDAAAKHAGLVLLLLLPGFFYVTYQNFGNDPQWLPLLGLLLMVYRPEGILRNGLGWDLRTGLAVTAAAAFALAAPSVFNLTYSPFRHLGATAEKHAPLLPRAALHSDLQTVALRVNRVDGRVALDRPGGGLEDWADKGERETPAKLKGEVLAFCELELGMSAVFDSVARDLVAAGYGGKTLFAADIFGSYWLFDDLKPLPGGAPWYYGNLSGLGAADYVIVPRCPVAPDVQARILRSIEANGIRLTEVRRTPLYILLEKTAS